VIEQLKRWFLRNARDLPWRVNRTPYKVWISEIMLQQTRVEVVISYYERWMEQFPTIQAIARSPLEDVIKAWEGLGYYSRARNIHETAKMISEDLPSDYSKLMALKGFGEYTTGAVLSFAFKKRWPAVDGNVTRVLARFFAIEDDVGRSSTKKLILQHAWDVLPHNEPWIVVEALIELGAIICKKQPLCTKCPLQFECKGHKEGIALELPKKMPPKKITELRRTVAVIESSGSFLVSKGGSQRVMADLWEFPYKEEPYEWSTWDSELQNGIVLRGCSHTFTRYRAHLSPLYFQLSTLRDFSGFTWVSREKMLELPFSSGHRLILKDVIERECLHV
jgi:A/G-specific adenine glycosylase